MDSNISINANTVQIATMLGEKQITEQPSTSGLAGLREALQSSEKQKDFLKGLSSLEDRGKQGQRSLQEILKGLRDELASEVGPTLLGFKKSPWKSDLNWVLTHEDNVDKLQTAGEFHQALGAHEGFKKFSRSQRDIGFLMRYCLSLMLTKRDEQAKALFENILKLIQNMGETFNSVLELAVSAMQDNKNFDAIILCMFAARMADMGNLTVIESAHKSKCMVILRDALDKVKNHTKKATPFFRRYCVEAVRPLFDDVMKTATGELPRNPIDLKIATFHCMEIIQLYADDDEGRAKTTEQALKFLEETYGDEVCRRKWYGVFSHNLGCTYLKLSRNVEAAAMIIRAYEVLQQAIDYDDENDKQSNITNTESMLKCTGIGGLVDFDF